MYYKFPHFILMIFGRKIGHLLIRFQDKFLKMKCILFNLYLNSNYLNLNWMETMIHFLLVKLNHFIYCFFIFSKYFDCFKLRVYLIMYKIKQIYRDYILSEASFLSLKCYFKFTKFLEYFLYLDRMQNNLYQNFYL